jgi:hypothetical protein
LAGRAAHAQALRRKAVDESADRADKLALADDDDGAAIWRRIMSAVTEFGRVH